MSGLPKLDAGLVRHTRAVILLRAGDPVAALGALDKRDETGDQELDQRLELLEAADAQIENGDPRPGLLRAEAMTQREHVDDSVRTEARVVRAAALDALGRREEALVVLAALGRESLQPLSQLGQPRIRALASQILEGRAERSRKPNTLNPMKTRAFRRHHGLGPRPGAWRVRRSGPARGCSKLSLPEGSSKC